MKETTICVVDDQRRIVREGKAVTEPESIAAFLSATGVSFERVGIESGPLAPWLCDMGVFDGHRVNPCGQG
jgi:transposase